MPSKRETTDPWEACPSGELGRMVQRLDTSQLRARRKQVFSTALLSTAVFACVVFVVGSMMDSNSTHYGGIACSYCCSHFDEYQPHVAGELVHEDAAFVTSMRVHLEKCSFCHDRFNATYPGLLSAGCAPSTRPVALVALRQSTRQPTLEPLLAITRQSVLY